MVYGRELPQEDPYKRLMLVKMVQSGAGEVGGEPETLDLSSVVPPENPRSRL